LATILWCETSSLAVILTGDIPLWLALIVLVLIPLVGLADERSAWLGPARTLSSILAIFYLFFFPLDWLVLSDRLIFAVVHLMFYLKVHTLLHLRTRRDRNRLYVLCLFEMLAAASMTINLTFVVPLVLFVVAGSLVLLLEQATLREQAVEERVLLKPALRSAIVLATVVLLVAGGIFVLLPRQTHGGFRLGGIRGITSTGLTDQIQLGDFGRIKRSRDVVMRVVAHGTQAASSPRWRGAAYDHYSNGEWTRTITGVSELPELVQGQFLLNRPSEAPRVVSEVFLEPLDTDVLFLPPASLSLSTSVPYVFVDAYLTVHTGRPARAGRRYTVEWRPDAPADSTSLGVVALEVEARQHYLQVPTLSKEFHGLVRELAPEGTVSVAETASVVESHFKNAYGYTLNTPPRRRDDPLEDFLFETRAGHCEHFATAMVMVLRALDVPSRVVTGFLRGEANDVGNFEVVRREDAHAWVEVFEQRRGWLTFDPTPSAPSSVQPRRFAFVTKSIDSLRMLWDMYVITFDYERQRGVLRGAGGVIHWLSVGGGWALSFAREQAKFFAMLGALLFVVCVLGVTRVGQRWRALLRFRWPFSSWRLGRQHPRSAVRFYGELLARLERLGFHRPPGVTPAEYAQKLEGQLPGLSELTLLYYRVRFGGLELGRTELARAERLAAAIRVAALSGGDLARISP
jgi:transglutaminase-like putative cysteine protease